MSTTGRLSGESVHKPANPRHFKFATEQPIRFSQVRDGQRLESLGRWLVRDVNLMQTVSSHLEGREILTLNNKNIVALALGFHEPIRPPLKWAGGKRWLLPALRSLHVLHQNRRLVEPFAGGLAVALGLSPAQALLNDSNPHLISFYRWIQKGLDLSAVDVDLRNDRAVFATNRSRFNRLISEGDSVSAEAAALFYYLNRTGYNGLCRFNSKGFFNVPFGRYAQIAYRTNFEEYAQVMRRFSFKVGDFAKLRLRRDDFVYADPPYDVEFTSYSAGGFDWDDQRRLAEWLVRHQGPVVASNQATKRVVELYRSLGFNVALIDAPRRISCDGNRKDALEILATLNL